MKNKLFSVLHDALTKKRNRLSSKFSRAKKTVLFCFELAAVHMAAAMMNIVLGAPQKCIPVEKRGVIDPKDGLVINLFGYTDASDCQGYGHTMESLAERLFEADLSFTAVRENEESQREDLEKLLASNRIEGLFSEDVLDAIQYETDAGNIGVVIYNRYHSGSKNKHIRIELVRYFRMLRRRGADYIILYVNERRKRSIGEREKSLFKMAAKSGVDYVVGVTPNLRNSGSAYLSRGKKVVRTIGSLGSFMANDESLSNVRLCVRIKIRPVKGRLQTIEETYFPYCRTSCGFFVPLEDQNNGVLSEQQRKEYLACAEQEMIRLRPASRLLHVSDLFEILQIPIPGTFQYMKDHSIGKICARSFEVAPGDVFFFRQPFEDPNDREPVDPKRRLRIAKKSARKGAMLLVSFQKLPFRCNYVQVEDAMEAHIAVCRHLREQFTMKAIGITGSIGKTSTKDMLAEVLKMKYNTVKSERNANVQVKIGMNLQQLDSACEMYIQEIGGGRPGGTSRHSRMVAPEVTVVTNIGDAHIGNFFGRADKLMENKLGIVDGMPANGVLYLNGDDPLLSKAKPNCKTVFYAVHNRNADYYAEDIVENGLNTKFVIVHGENRAHVELNVLGEYNVLNAVCCCAIGEHFGIPMWQIAEGLSNFSTSGVRQNLVSVCGRKLFMDCYNASSESVRTSLEVLSKLRLEPGKKRVAVFGDITGMGELSESVHREMGKSILQRPADQIILYGQEVQYTYEELLNNGIKATLVKKHDELDRLVEENVKVGDAVMFKGSSKMLLEQSADVAFGTRFTDQRLLDEAEYRRVYRNGIGYNLFDNYATAATYGRRNKKSVQVAKNILSFEVVNLAAIFRNSEAVSVKLPGGIRHIDQFAFENSQLLESVYMPAALKFIGDSAFANCVNLKEMQLPKGLLHIGKEAFAGCSSLKEIRIPDSVVQIDSDAFRDCGAVLVCGKGSYAASYLDMNGIPYETVR